MVIRMYSSQDPQLQGPSWICRISGRAPPPPPPRSQLYSCTAICCKCFWSSHRERKSIWSIMELLLYSRISNMTCCGLVQSRFGDYYLVNGSSSVTGFPFPLTEKYFCLLCTIQCSSWEPISISQTLFI